MSLAGKGSLTDSHMED